MALQPQVLSIPMQMGLDTKDNPTLVDNQRLTVIQNGRFVKGENGQLQARNGYNALSRSIIGGGTITSGQSIATLNNELDIVGNGSLYAYSPSQAGEWANRGALTACVPSRQKIVRNNYNQTLPDCASMGGVSVYAWIDSRAGAWCKFVDSVSGTVLYPETQIASGVVQVRCIPQTATSRIVVVVSYASGEINYGQVDPTAAASGFVAGGTLIASCLPASPFEIIDAANFFFLVYLTTAGYATVAKLNHGTLAVIGSVTPRNVAVKTVSICFDGNNHLAIVSQAVPTAPVPQNATGVMYMDFYTATLVSVASYNHAVPFSYAITVVPSQITTTTVFVIGSSAIYVNGFTATNGKSYPLVWQYIWDESTGYGTTGLFANGCSLVSSFFQQGGISYGLISNVSTVQPTYFLAQLNADTPAPATIVGRYISGNAGAVPVYASVTSQLLDSLVYSSQSLTHPQLLSSGEWLVAVPVEAELESSGGNPVIVTGLDALTLDFTQTEFNSTQIGGDLSLSGGLPQLYDCEVISENGFNLSPEAPLVQIMTSMIGLTSIVDGTAISGGPTMQSFVITIPVNQVNAGQDGSLLINSFYGYAAPAEYITIGTSNAFWFNVLYANTGNTAPANLGSMTLTEITLTPFTTAIQTAGYLATAINGASIGFTAVANGNQVTVTANSAGAQPRPQTYSQFNVCQTDYSGGTPSIGVNCVPGLLIQPGTYFTFCGGFSSPTTPVYVWFQVGGVGVDPAPPGLTPAGTSGTSVGGFSVNVLATDTEAQVATKLMNAANAWNQGGMGTPLTATIVNGPIVSIATVASGTYTYPTIGTMQNGLGTVGTAVATNQWDSYAWCAMYENQDAQGQLGRSGLSAPTVVQMPAYGTGNFQVMVSYNPAYLTARASVDVAIYRTQTLGQLFYRASSEVNLLYSVAADQYQNFQDAVPDSTLQSNELAYTQPLIPNSVLPNNCPPAFTQLASFQDQLWINDCEDPQLWWFSKNFTTGVQVEYSVNQTWRFDPVGGPTIAALTMDSNLIVFGSRGIWAVNGLGPDSTGAGTPFTVQLISSAVGLRDPGSPVLTPNGIMFMSAKGIHLLDRGLQVHYIGMPVEAFNANVISSAQVVPNTTEVRFLSAAAGATLLYDYQFDQWGTFTQHAGVDSIIYNGVYSYLTGSGFVYQEAPGVYADDTVKFPFLFTTAWIKLANLQGFAKVWRFLVQGYFPANVKLQVSVAYNYNPAVVDVFTLLNQTDQTQFKQYFSQLNAEAIQITIQDVAPLSSSAKFSVDMIDIEYGVMTGTYRNLGNRNTLG